MAVNVAESSQLSSEPILPPGPIEHHSIPEQGRHVELGRRIMAAVPPEALARMQIIQPAIGCLNRCDFCSQVAGATVRELGSPALSTIMKGLRHALQETGIALGGDRQHKPGVIFPYLDNDIGSYPHLDEYVDQMADLGATTRISTVGWSRHSDELQAMHERIVSDHMHQVEGVRFSLTPYTYGWRQNHDAYIADLANALRTYRPLLEEKGASRATACIELRFEPDIALGELEMSRLDQYYLMRCDDYTLVTREDLTERDDRVAGIDDNQDAFLNTDGAIALQLIGDTAHLTSDTLDRLFMTTPEYGAPDVDEPAVVLVSKGRAYRSANKDGEYYSFEPLKKADNSFRAVQYYPQTAKRAVGGVMDASRPLLNHLVAYKARHDIGPRQSYDQAGEADITAVLAGIEEEANIYERFSPRRATYIREKLLPLVQDAITVMREAGLGPDSFFRYGLMIDTGVIVNQGKALHLFRGLASSPDTPLTLNEEKGYGTESKSSARGTTWRMAPMLAARAIHQLGGLGGKSRPVEGTRTQLVLGFHELNPEAFQFTEDGRPLQNISVEIGDLVPSLDKLTPATGKTLHRMPGA